MDNGIGIPDNDFKNVFDKGYRGINAKEQENASGLGLYYVETIAKHLNIKVELQNNKNMSGITTSFKFPKYK